MLVTPSSSASRANRAGFTIVELMVTIAVIAALMSLLLVGLQAARRSSKVTQERNAIKQVYLAWMQYASNYDDAAMPGYIEAKVQTDHWGVKYKAKDGTAIPAQYCENYPHRLLPYLDHGFSTLYEYLGADDDDFFKATIANSNGDPVFNTTGIKAMSLYPAFGYNAYYVGGWWRELNGSPVMRFHQAVWQDANNVKSRGRIVATKASNLADPSRMVIFSGAALRSQGVYKSDKEDDDGAAFVVPHVLADKPMWLPSDGTNFGNMNGSGHTSLSLFLPTLAQAWDVRPVQAAGASLRVQSSTAIGVPHRRYGSQVTVVHGDGSTAGAGIGELTDQRRWMNPAMSARDPVNFTHSDID